MPNIDVGPLTLLVPEADATPDTENLPRRGSLKGRSSHGVVMADGGVMIDVRYFLAETGEGIVMCPSIKSSPPQFERLTRGARLGTYPAPSGGTCIRQLRVLRFDPEQNWGNPTRTTLDELDVLAQESFSDLMHRHGALKVGMKKDVFGDGGDDIAVTWAESSSPLVPMLAYAITRIMPVLLVTREQP